MTSSIGKAGAARSMLALARSLSAGWWLLIIAVTSLTNLLDFLAAAQPDAARSPQFAAAALIRVALVFWVSYALIRRLGDHAAPMRLSPAFARFVLLAFAQLALVALAAGAARLIVGPSEARESAALLTTYLLLTLIMLVLIRLYAWQAALALGDRTLGAAGAWRRLAPYKLELATAYLLIVPVAALHMLLTEAALAGGSPGRLAVLALVDGLVSAGQLALSCSLAVAAWRLASARAEPLREGVAVA